MNLNCKTAIISGAGRGIGKQIAIDLAKEGCNIVAAARTKKQLNETISEIAQYGVKVIGFNKDISIQKNILELIRSTIDTFGKIDILINNAGIVIKKDYIEQPIEEYDEIMNINLRSMFLICQQVLKQMIVQQSGYIINISSTGAIAVTSDFTAYGISKKGVLGLTEAMYDIGRKNNIKVSTILPGVTNTNMAQALFPDEKEDQWLQPSDISSCVKFLLNQSNRMIIKEIIPWSVGHDRIS